MKRFLLVLAGTAVLLVGTAARAGGWERLWRQLDGWEGPPTVALSTDLADPYASAVYRRLVNGLTERGFTVRPADRADAPEPGLRVELEETDRGPVIALTRTRDGALLLVDTLQAGEPPAEEPPAPGDRPRVRRDDAAPATRAGRMRRLTIDGHPVRLAALPGAAENPGGGVALALLYDDRVEWGRLDWDSFTRKGRFRIETEGADGLYVDGGELDGDPPPEIAAVWGENRRVPTRGWSTRLHGRLLQVDGERIRPETPALRRYLRVVSGSVLTQARGEHAAHDGPVRRLERNADGDFAVGESVPGWQGRWLYGVTPLPRGRTAVWSAPDRLAVHAGPDPGSRLLGAAERLGEPGTPAVTVRLRQPDIGMGPDAAERRNQREVPLPRRLVVGRDGALYTLRRGRREVLAGLTEPTGADSVIRLTPSAGGLRMEPTHEPIAAYILDFDLIERRGAPGRTLVLLLNEEADGSGQASLVTLALQGRSDKAEESGAGRRARAGTGAGSACPLDPGIIAQGLLHIFERRRVPERDRAPAQAASEPLDVRLLARAQTDHELRLHEHGVGIGNVRAGAPVAEQAAEVAATRGKYGQPALPHGVLIPRPAHSEAAWLDGPRCVCATPYREPAIGRPELRVMAPRGAALKPDVQRIGWHTDLPAHHHGGFVKRFLRAAGGAGRTASRQKCHQDRARQVHDCLALAR